MRLPWRDLSSGCLRDEVVRIAPHVDALLFLFQVVCQVLFPVLSRSKIGFSSAEGLLGRLPGTEAERFGMGPAVVLGQDLAEVPGPVGDGAVADLAARDRKMGDGHKGSGGILDCSSHLMMPAPPQ